MPLLGFRPGVPQQGGQDGKQGGAGRRAQGGGGGEGGGARDAGVGRRPEAAAGGSGAPRSHSRRSLQALCTLQVRGPPSQELTGNSLALHSVSKPSSPLRIPCVNPTIMMSSPGSVGHLVSALISGRRADYAIGRFVRVAGQNEVLLSYCTWLLCNSRCGGFCRCEAPPPVCQWACGQER